MPTLVQVAANDRFPPRARPAANDFQFVAGIETDVARQETVTSLPVLAKSPSSCDVVKFATKVPQLWQVAAVFGKS